MSLTESLPLEITVVPLLKMNAFGFTGFAGEIFEAFNGDIDGNLLVNVANAITVSNTVNVRLASYVPISVSVINTPNVSVTNTPNVSVTSQPIVNSEFTIAASAARSGTVNINLPVNTLYRGMWLIFNVTAIGGNLTPTLQGQDFTSGNWYNMETLPTINATGLYDLQFYPALLTSPIPSSNHYNTTIVKTMRLTINHTVGATYSISGVWVV